MKLKYKKLVPDAIIPTKGTPGSAGYDLYAVKDFDLYPDQVFKVGTGISFEIPLNHKVSIQPRGSMASRGIIICNTPGTIDSDYRGEIFVLLGKFTSGIYSIKKGDKIAQMEVIQTSNIEFEEVQELSKTERGEGGFGSTGR